MANTLIKDTADTRSEYVKVWHRHIAHTDRLAWNLSKEDYDRLKELQAELNGLVVKASKSVNK